MCEQYLGILVTWYPSTLHALHIVSQHLGILGSSAKHVPISSRQACPSTLGRVCCEDHEIIPAGDESPHRLCIYYSAVRCDIVLMSLRSDILTILRFLDPTLRPNIL